MNYKNNVFKLARCIFLAFSGLLCAMKKDDVVESESFLSDDVRHRMSQVDSDFAVEGARYVLYNTRGCVWVDQYKDPSTIIIYGAKNKENIFLEAEAFDLFYYKNFSLAGTNLPPDRCFRWRTLKKAEVAHNVNVATQAPFTISTSSVTNASITPVNNVCTPPHSKHVWKKVNTKNIVSEQVKEVVQVGESDKKIDAEQVEQEAQVKPTLRTDSFFSQIGSNQKIRYLFSGLLVVCVGGALVYCYKKYVKHKQSVAKNDDQIQPSDEDDEKVEFDDDVPKDEIVSA